MTFLNNRLENYDLLTSNFHCRLVLAGCQPLTSLKHLLLCEEKPTPCSKIASSFTHISLLFEKKRKSSFQNTKKRRIPHHLWYGRHCLAELLHLGPRSERINEHHVSTLVRKLAAKEENLRQVVTNRERTHRGAKLLHLSLRSKCNAESSSVLGP